MPATYYIETAQLKEICHADSVREAARETLRAVMDASLPGESIYLGVVTRISTEGFSPAGESQAVLSPTWELLEEIGQHEASDVLKREYERQRAEMQGL